MHLNTKYYIANARYVNYEEKTFKNDISILRELYAPYDLMTCPELEEIYHTDGNKWSAYGEVKWCKVIMKQ